MNAKNAVSDDALQPLNDAIQQEIGGDRNPSTAWRWITQGIAGLNGERIRLQVWYVGRAPHTTKAAIRAFISEVTEARRARIRERVADVTDSELAAVGLTSQRP